MYGSPERFEVLAGAKPEHRQTVQTQRDTEVGDYGDVRVPFAGFYVAFAVFTSCFQDYRDEGQQGFELHIFWVQRQHEYYA